MQFQSGDRLREEEREDETEFNSHTRKLEGPGQRGHSKSWPALRQTEYLATIQSGMTCARPVLTLIIV
jgi:hypothetical protein